MTLSEEFVKEVQGKDMFPLDILNQYCISFCHEDENTERGIMVKAIYDIIMQLRCIYLIEGEEEFFKAKEENSKLGEPKNITFMKARSHSIFD